MKAKHLGDASDVLWDLIGDHAKAMARFGRAVTRCDESEAKRCGWKITAADRAECDRADKAEEQAFIAVVSAPCGGDRSVLAHKLVWLKAQLARGEALEDERLDTFLSSLVPADSEVFARVDD